MRDKKAPLAVANSADKKPRLARPPSPVKSAADAATVFKPSHSASAVATSSTEQATVFKPRAPQIPPAATHYTEYRATTGQQHSTGFAKAHELAEQALRGGGTGTLLKKRFLLEEVLGQGGMGTVYRAKDLRKGEAEDPNPYIAAKVLNQDFRDHPDAFVTLQQETAKSQTLAHPNIVTVHDFDRDGDTLYMTMELLDGQPLDQLLREHPQGLAKTTALKLCEDLCAALMYAHKRHLIHADFKPGNVFVMNDGSAKVLDFGIARAASKDAQKHRFYAVDLGALTPAYATIEMISDEPISFADDVYALACVTYEMLTGHHPYNRLSASDAHQQNLKPKRPGKLNNAQWRALSHALALQKNQRTASVAQLAAELFPRKKSFALKLALTLLPISLAAVGWLAYSHHQGEAQRQTVISTKLQRAQTCFAQMDFSCAVEQSRVVTNLDAGNSVASALLVSAQQALQKQQHEAQISQLLSEAKRCFAAKDFACAELKAKELLALAPDNRAANSLRENSELAQKIMRMTQQIDLCLQNNDLTCAEQQLNEALTLAPGNADLMARKNQLLVVQTGRLQQQQQINQYRESAQQCLQQKNYVCAITQAENIQAIDADNTQAVEIKQTALFAREQQANTQKRVDKILAQARLCLDKQKNYSCAIAKAEAALDLNPENAAALDIKQRAQTIQQQLKTTGFTIQ